MNSLKIVVTAQAPVNIAVIKYWGKSDELLKIPINDSISGTLSCDEMRTVTSVYLSETYNTDQLVLNGIKQELCQDSPAKLMLDEIRHNCSDDRRACRAHIVSVNNFPTAAGLASSAAGYACLAFALGHAYGTKDPAILSRIARKGSGSACRSIFGGFVHWEKGLDHETSVAKQIVDHNHWSEMRVIICVVNDRQKDVSSSSGMANSVRTSDLLKFRAEKVVPERISAMKDAIINKDFQKFSDLTMKDSNQFHAVCLDTYPPLFYLNDSSRHIIKICSLVNSYYGENKVAYTFDAGPNACIYLLDDFVEIFLGLVRHYFPRNVGEGAEVEIRGNRGDIERDNAELDSLIKYLVSKGIETLENSLNYIVSTSIGEGSKLINEHLEDKHLN